MSFKEFGLHESLLNRLVEIGYETPTPIQREAIPLVMQGRDLLGSAQTGTGKTAAFMLPVLHRLLTEPAIGTQVLVLEPTRELALQVEEQAKTFSKLTQLRSACFYGGVGFGPQEKAFADGVEVIAATPGRLLDHIRQGNVRFDKLRVLVLDEVDRMLDMGFLPDVRSILRQLPERRQTLFFSATVPSEIGRLADGMLKEPAKVAITPDRKTAEGITQAIYPVSDHLKTALLEQLLNHEHVTSALVFTRTKQGADKVCAVVERMGLPVQRIHGDLSQGQRLKALAQFKEGVAKFLVATDIAARGLDVEGISHVINYDLPDSPDDYVHRIGRTARASATGHAYSLFAPRDAANLAAIERHLGQKLEKQMLEGFNYEEPLSTLHEVRQGHDGIKDYDDLGSGKAAPERTQTQSTGSGQAYAPRSSGGLRPAPYSDSDEHASVTLVFAAPGMEAAAPGESSGDGYSSRGGGDTAGGFGGGDRGGRKRGRGGRGGSGGGRGERSGGGDRGPRGGADRPPRSDRPSFSAGDRPVDAKRGERHQANASLSASDVLRKASDQQAVVGNDDMGARRGPATEAEPRESFAPHEERGPRENFAPREARESQAPREARENFAPREDRGPRMDSFDKLRTGSPQGDQGMRPAGEGDGPRKRRRRRGRGGQGGGEGAASGAPRPQGGGFDRGFQGQGGRNDRGGSNNGQRFDRNGRNDRPRNDNGSNSAAKPSLWQRLKSTLGMGGGSGDLGGKW
jgi:ATP-dependent RNA helicase RhlE